MLNDRSASELISRSLSGDLQQTDLDAVADRVEADENTRNFARLSRLIHDSVSEFAQRTVAGDESVAPGLDEAAKQRIKKSIRRESAQLSAIDPGATVTPNSAENSTQTGGHRSGLTDQETRELTSRFTLVRKLGQGGLGTVWLARDEKLNRSVALKEMNPEVAEFPRAWERFHREAEITGHLEHPNVVPMYQFGMDAATGTPFYAMRFVGKRTLVDAIEEYHDRKSSGEDVTMDLHRLLSAFIGVCQAIAYAHSRGVIHRDLKPENVALDNFGQVIVLDWGLAKISEEHELDSVLSGPQVPSDSVFAQTLAGEVIGTPLYMAPEQAAGELDRVDERTDVYGLGAILFAMLTGSAPHQKLSVDDDDSAVPMPELLQRVATRPSPTTRDYLDDVPADLDAICRRAMHPKAHSRFQSAAAVADAVQQWMAGRSQRRQIYSNCRTEGRELRSTLQSAVRDLERNVRFMSDLPPIQGIIDVRNERSKDELSVWRERLSVIFAGLLRTNGDFNRVSFAEVRDGQFHELLRLDRQASDSSNIRSIPASRLATGPLTACMSTALNGHPDEVHIALSSECPEERRAAPSQATRIAAVVPVFDAVSEELFGFVMIEACIARLIERQVRARFSSVGHLYVLDNECRVLLEFERDGSRFRENEGQAMSCVTDCWTNVLKSLKTRGEFIDENDNAVYATRIDLVPGRYSLAIAMCLGEGKKRSAVGS